MTWAGRVRVVAAIVMTEFRRVLRDRMALFFIIVLPVAIIVIVGVVFGAAPTRLRVGLVDNTGSASTHEFVEALRDDGVLEIEIVALSDDLERGIRTRDLMAGLVVTERAGRPVIEVLAPPDSEMVPILETTVESAAAGTASVGIVTETIGATPLIAENQYAYTAPANLVLFVFVNSVSAGVAMVESRRLGVMERMLAAPVTPTMIVLGFGMNRLLFALAQSVLILVVGSILFGVDWGSPTAAAVLVVTWSAVGAMAGLAVGAVARTPEQVTAIGLPVSLGFSMLGGCLWPLGIVGSTMSTVGHVTPQAWAMDAWVELVFDGAGLRAISGNLVILTAFAVILAGVSVYRLRRTLIT